MRRAAGRAGIAVVVLLTALPARPVAAQTTAAKLTREQKPTYPEGLVKIQKQGNVVLTGRIDARGKVQDIQAVAATNLGFVDSAVEAVKAWQFGPATRGGRPIDIAANISVRFRLEGKKRGEIPRPVLGDLSVFPASAAGARAAPEGFPIRRGADPRLRAEAIIDLAPLANAQKLAIRADAVSPKGRRISLYSATVPVAANAHEIAVSFTAPIGADWEDGIWGILFFAAEGPAGGGQFWLAGDPEHFDFASIAAKKAAESAAAPPVAAPGAPTAPPRPTLKPTARPHRT